MRGVRKLRMSDCVGVADAGLGHLRGIHSLEIGGCTGITDTGQHLRGIHEVTDAVHLRGHHPHAGHRSEPAAD